MAADNGSNDPTDLHETRTSKSQDEPDTVSDVNRENQDEKTNTVPFYKLFAFADSKDVLLMSIGTISAVGNGLSMPLMTILFGNLVNSFGQNQSTNQVVDVVSQVPCL